MNTDLKHNLKLLLYPKLRHGSDCPEIIEVILSALRDCLPEKRKNLSKAYHADKVDWSQFMDNKSYNEAIDEMESNLGLNHE